jgi:methionyl-tRNA formyltransferase
MGNEMVPALLADRRVELCAVFTREYANAYPYYPTPQLWELCRDLKVPYHTNTRVSSGEGLELLRSYRPELVVVSGYHEILRRQVIELPTAGIVNVHPSLLPSYRGAVPDQAVLLDGQSVTGVSYHHLTEDLDLGNILIQLEYRLREGETIGTLRKALAELAATGVPQLLDLCAGGRLPPGRPQVGTATFAPKRYKEPVPLDGRTDAREIDRMVRALAPFPGVTVQAAGGARRVRSSAFLTDPAREPGEPGGFVDVPAQGGTLRLYLEPPTPS